MEPHYSLHQGYQSKILAKEHWMENKTVVIPEGAIAIFTDGSRELWEQELESSSVGWKIYIYSLWNYVSVFQAETYAILQCASLLKTLELVAKPTFICSDSLSAIRALHKPTITSKLIR